MFDLAEKRLVWIPIVWKGLRQPSPDALAEPCEFEIQVLVEIVEREQIQEFFGGAIEDDDPPEVRERKERGNKLTEVQRFRALVSDWRNLRLGGEPAEFNDQNIAALLRRPNFALGFDTSYLRAWGGQIELAEKNSEDSSASGQAGEGNRTARRKSKSGKKRNS